jgi:hypothetical protein
MYKLQGGPEARQDAGAHLSTEAGASIERSLTYTLLRLASPSFAKY